MKDYKLLRMHPTAGQCMLIIGVSVSISSQFCVTIWAEGFRLSMAAVLYPVLLMLLMRSSHRPTTGLVTGLCIITIRTILDLMSGLPLAHALWMEYPGAVFYVTYECILCVLIPDRRSAGYVQTGVAFCVCDIFSNCLNLVLSGRELAWLDSKNFLALVTIGILRGGLAVLILWLGSVYHQLLQRQEHERRYQRLFIMTAELKNELYFLKKDSEGIEGVMARAYQLYEQLGELDVPEETRTLALSIAREVHEIKKDNLRIIRGIEGEVADVYDREEMHISDLFCILEDSTRRLLGEQRAEIRLECFWEDNIKIIEHYRVLSIIKNLVTNAVEAIQSEKGYGVVRVEEEVKNGRLVLTISDNGPGITPRAMNNLFKVGFTTKYNLNTGSVGRGVGLSAVQFIVEELKGDIKVDSTPGKGARFTVELPLESIQGD